jgi:hypothetical protein
MPLQLTPDQTALLRDLAMPALKIEHETTRRVIQAIPPEKADYRPDSVRSTARATTPRRTAWPAKASRSERAAPTRTHLRSADLLLLSSRVDETHADQANSLHLYDRLGLGGNEVWCASGDGHE